MTSTVTTPSRPLAAGCRRTAGGPRRSGPVVLSLKGPPRRRTTSCAALASPEKQRTARSKQAPAKEDERQAEESTDYNEVAAALESIYKLSPAVVDDDDKAKKKKRKQGRVVSDLAYWLSAQFSSVEIFNSSELPACCREGAA